MTLSSLWVEKYRPKTVEQYVFRDQSQKRQVMQWIKDKSIPHILLSGTAGIGKCLDASEQVLVKFEVESLTQEQLLQLEPFLVDNAFDVAC